MRFTFVMRFRLVFLMIYYSETIYISVRSPVMAGCCIQVSRIKAKMIRRAEFPKNVAIWPSSNCIAVRSLKPVKSPMMLAYIGAIFANSIKLKIWKFISVLDLNILPLFGIFSCLNKFAIKKYCVAHFVSIMERPRLAVGMLFRHPGQRGRVLIQNYQQSGCLNRLIIDKFASIVNKELLCALR